MTIYKIGDAGRFLDARIEIDGSSIILHSRGGATGGRPARNQGYEEALITIVRRLRAHDGELGPAIGKILLDSLPARKVPPGKRVLARQEEMLGLTDRQVVTLIRSRARVWGQTPTTKGGNSTKQIRIEVPGRSRHSLRSTLRLQKWSAKAHQVERLPNGMQRKVTSAQIKEAVRRMIAGEDAPNFSDSRDYDLRTPEGRRFAPKKVFALALEDALGIEAFPGHFQAGWSQPSFELLQAAGFDIVSKGTWNASPTEADKAAKTISLSDEDREFIEGDKRMAGHFRSERSRNAQAPREKRAQTIKAHGRLICELCGDDHVERHGADVAAGCFEIHHTVPLASLDEERKTKLADLQCLCATCHRAVHRKMVLQG